jgi:arylsulfatase A-like enzyme
MLGKTADHCSALVSLTDLFPTICETAGVNVPAAVEGKSLLALYQGKPVAWRQQVFASHHSPARHGMSTRCVRSKRYKLIEQRLTGEVELFDLQTDPYELVNLAGSRDHAAIRAKLEAELAQWGATHGPTPDEPLLHE